MDSYLVGGKPYFYKALVKVAMNNVGITSEIADAKVTKDSNINLIISGGQDLTWYAGETHEAAHGPVRVNGQYYEDINSRNLPNKILEHVDVVRENVEKNNDAIYGDIIGTSKGIISTIDELPVVAEVGDKYYISSTNKIVTCTSGPVYGQLQLRVTDPAGEALSSYRAEGDIPIEFVLNSNEKLDCIIHSSETIVLSEVIDQLIAVFEEYGYEEDRSWKACNPGTYYTTDSNFVRITAKQPLSGTIKRSGGSYVKDKNGVDITNNESINHYGITIVYGNTKNTVYSKEGVETSTWDAGTTVEDDSGLISRVSTLEIPNAFSSDDRPTLALTPTGYCYFDIDKGYPLWKKGGDPEDPTDHGSWVNSSGTVEFSSDPVVHNTP